MGSGPPAGAALVVGAPPAPSPGGSGTSVGGSISEAPGLALPVPTRSQLRAACFLGIMDLHVPSLGATYGYPTINREAFDFLLETNAEMLAKDL